jgi:hypothetical protein
MDTLPLPYIDEVAKERDQIRWRNLTALVAPDAH